MSSNVYEKLEALIQVNDTGETIIIHSLNLIRERLGFKAKDLTKSYFTPNEIAIFSDSHHDIICTYL